MHKAIRKYVGLPFVSLSVNLGKPYQLTRVNGQAGNS